MKNSLVAVVALAVFTLAGCTKTSEDQTEMYKMPRGMENCEVHKLVASGTGKTLRVVFCPHGDTHTRYPNGKSTRVTSVVHGD